MMEARPTRRVVITGMGVVAANGCDLDTFWTSVRAGTSAARKVTRFDASELPNQVACEIRDFNPTRYMDAKKPRRFELSILYGIAAARMASTDAGVDLAQQDPDRAGIIEGTSVS
jgi:3-oxoacyl-[acyl-carrier-protein] synthase II